MPSRHRLERSEMVVVGDGELRFLAVCSCGWRSELLRPNRIHVAWEDHLDAVRRTAEPVS